MVPAPLEQVHVQPGGVGDLEEADAVAGDVGQRGTVVATREQVEGVDGQGDRGVVGADHGLPRLADPVDVPSPGECLEGHGHAGLGRDLADAVQLLGAEVEVVDGSGGGVRAGQQGRRTQLGHHAELGAQPVQDRLERVGCHALDVTDGLEQRDLQPEVRAARGHLARRERRPDQVVVEELDRVEPGAGGGDELVLEHAAEGDRRDALAHQPVSSLKWASIRAGSAGRPVKYSKAPTACWTAIPPPGSTRQPRARAAATSAVSSGK